MKKFTLLVLALSLVGIMAFGAVSQVTQRNLPRSTPATAAAAMEAAAVTAMAVAGTVPAQASPWRRT